MTKLRNIVPPSLIISEGGWDNIEGLDEDCHRVEAISGCYFNLHRIKRDRKKWVIVYYARENHGIGEAVAELRLQVGELYSERESRSVLGMQAELTSYMPSRTEPRFCGKIAPCAKLILRHRDTELAEKWVGRNRSVKATVKVEGTGITDSPRDEVGLNDGVATDIRNAVITKKEFKEAKARAEERRWLYAKNWKQWPSKISLHVENGTGAPVDFSGEYIRAACRQTTNQSGLWVKNGVSNNPTLYILIRPSVNRTGPSKVVVSSSLNHYDLPSVIAVFPHFWQPCDAFESKAVTFTIKQWTFLPDMKCMIPKPNLIVCGGKDDDDTLVEVNGLSNEKMLMFCRGSQNSTKDIPKLPPYSGQLEQNAARGVWIPHTSRDPYGGGNNNLNQRRRDQSAFYTYRYSQAIEALRQKTFKDNQKGVPVEYFEWDRLIVDEVHESLCTTKGEMENAKESAKQSDSGYFKEKNRRAGRELLGITQRDTSRRPLVCRRAVFGLTGTPLLDSSSRVIELANLIGGCYVIGLSSHWRKLERESSRDIFLHNYLEPKQSREVRKAIHAKAQEFLDTACCRNKSGEEMAGIQLNSQTLVVQMNESEKTAYLNSQSGIPASKKSLAIRPGDFDVSAGHDISRFLRQNAKLECRGKELVRICNEILEKDPRTKIVVFTDGKIGGGIAARDFLQASGLGCTWLDVGDSAEHKNEKIGWYQHGDATEEDRKRPRVLLLHFEHKAGLNLQSECYNLILFSPLYVGVGGSSSDPVADCSTELQAIGRVFRAGQPRPQVNVYRIEVQGPDDEECHLIRRNTDETTIEKAVNAGDN